MFDDIIQINMLGSFEMSCGDVHFSASDMGNQSCGLFSFLLTHKNCSSEKIIDALWPEGINNPAAALKNLVYRIRKALTGKNFPHAKDFIVSYQGTYKINSDIKINVDVDMMESAFVNAKKATDISAKAELYSTGINLYKGDFLENLPQYEWILPLSQHYHSVFFKNLYPLLEIYHNQKNYTEMLTLTKRAVQLDKFEEAAHKYLMYAYFKNGESAKAIAYYRQVTELFYNGLGVALSASMQGLYKEITAVAKSTNTDIQTLQNELKESAEEPQQALFCNMDVFRQLYLFTARSSIRTGASFFIGLLTLSVSESETEFFELQETAMVHLKTSILYSLRNGDAFTRCSPGQYLLLLPMINFENGVVVLKRIEKKYKSLFDSKKVSISHNLQPVEPSFWT